MKRFSLRQNAADLHPRDREEACLQASRTIDSIFAKISDALLQPLMTLTGMRLRLVSAPEENGAWDANLHALCEGVKCRNACDFLHPSMLERLQDMRENRCLPRSVTCDSGFNFFLIPIITETVAVGFIEGVLSNAPEPHSLERVSGGPPPERRLDSALNLLRGIAETAAEEVKESGCATPGPYPLPLQKALRFIEENLTEKLTLSKVAYAAGLSEDYFSKRFRNALGISFNAFLVRERIARARKLLVSTEQNIAEAAFACGFESISHFNRSFKQATGVSPKRYRQQQRRTLVAPASPE